MQLSKFAPRAIVAIAGGIVLIACQQVRTPTDGADTTSMAISHPNTLPSPERDLSARGVALAPVAPPAFKEMAQSTGAGVEHAQQLPVPPVAGSMIIRNGNVTIQVDSLEIAIERVRQLALSLGGQLGNVSVLTGANSYRSATLEMKIPAANFDSAMTGMPALGKVEQSNATAQDVGEEFVDISARVANARRLESRLLALLTTNTGKLSDVIAVERELARVRQEIERHEGRIRYLSTRVATSTIVTNVHEKAPIIAAPGTNVFGRAFVNMWRNFVAFLAGAIELMGVLVPVAAIAGLVYLGWRRWRSTHPVVRPSES